MDSDAPHSSFEPLIQLDPDCGERTNGRVNAHSLVPSTLQCNRRKIVSRHYSLADKHSVVYATVATVQTLLLKEGRSRLPLVETPGRDQDEEGMK